MPLRNDSAERLRQLLDSAPPTPVARVASFWRSQTEERRTWAAADFRRLSHWLVQSGEPLLGYDVAAEGLRRAAPRDHELRRSQAHALGRTGAWHRANHLLQTLRSERPDDEETVGLLASTYKALALEAPPGSRARRAYFRRALEVYETAHHGGIWTGINIAALQLLLGEPDAARSAAERLTPICRREIEQLEGERYDDHYWAPATLAEARLILGDWQGAAQTYTRAVARCEGKWGNVATTARQARLLLPCLDLPDEAVAEIENALDIPAVTVFVGHMIDLPDRPRPRFPPEHEAVARRAILERLREVGAGFGYSSGAMGGDLLFQECLHETGSEAHLVLPFPEEEFIATSVDLLPEANWRARFDSALSRANETIVASRNALDWGGVIYEYAGALVLGRAQMRAEQLQTRLVPIALWDGRPGDGPGGTASMVEIWREHGHAVDVIRLDRLSASTEIPLAEDEPRAPARTLPPIEPAARPPLELEIKSILFADLVGFSDLNEGELVAFYQHVLHRIAEFAADTAHEPRIRNTWGDGLFCIFDHVRDAVHFALGLKRLMLDTRWEELGLPPGLALRIGLHAGPVLACTDPVTTRPTYLGTHVNLASRIEPEAQFQEIFASWAFAALARIERVDDIVLDYVGRLPLHRISEPLPAYRVTARA